HGINSSRAAMLMIADRFAAAGMVVAAIDAVKHGARSYCHSVTNAECVSGSTCQACDGTNPLCGKDSGGVNNVDYRGQGDTASGGGVPGKCSGATAID